MRAAHQQLPPPATKPESDPVLERFLRAPVGRPDTPEELALIAEAMESGDVDGAEVTAMLHRRTRR
jgi:hypothetical protein